LQAQWEELKSECLGCNKCELSLTRTNVVFGVGNINSRLMFIGEGPGESEDLQGIPFVGRAGKLLDKYFEAVGIERDDIYIANILKCRPPQNRDPAPAEEEACIDYLRAQVKLIQPNIIVCLGRISGQRLMKPDLRITKEHGIWVKKAGVMMTTVYHPSYLLRPNPQAREQMLTDMKEIVRMREELRGGGSNG